MRSSVIADLILGGGLVLFVFFVIWLINLFPLMATGLVVLAILLALIWAAIFLMRSFKN